MRLILTLIIMMLSWPALADYRSEKAAIEKFNQEVFQNPNNYLPAPPDELPGLTQEFLELLNSDTKALRYFLILTSDMRWRNRYKLVKPFALHLESKFEGKPLTPPQLDLVSAVVADFILSDSDAVIKKAFLTVEASDAYFESNMAKLQDVVFRWNLRP